MTNENLIPKLDLNKSMASLNNQEKEEFKVWLITTLVGRGLSPQEAYRYLDDFKRILGEKVGYALMQCTLESIRVSLGYCATLKLPPCKDLGLGYFIPYKGICTFSLSYKGMRTLMIRERNTDEVKAIIIREGDTFEYAETLEGTTLYYKPANAFVWSGAIKGVFAYSEKKGRRTFVLMSKGEIDKIRGYAKTQDFWNAHYEQMAKKTAIRRLFDETAFSPLGESNTIAEIDNQHFADKKEILLQGNKEKEKELPEDYKANDKATAKEILLNELKNIEV